MLAFVDAARLTGVMISLTAPELREDPNDVIALFLRHSAEQFGRGTRTFASVYLVIHGVIKLLLVIGLLRRKQWSYPASIWVLAGFILYQGHRYSYTHSPWLIALSLLDVTIIFLMWHEYRLVKKHGFSWREKTT